MLTYRPGGHRNPIQTSPSSIEGCHAFIDFVAENTGATTAAFDSQGRQMYSARVSNPFCEKLCDAMQPDTLASTCIAAHRQAFEDALATGSPTTFTCFMGLSNYAVPILKDGEVMGVLAGGQVLIDAPSAAQRRELERLVPNRAELLFEELKKLPPRPDFDPNRHAELFSHIAGQLCASVESPVSRRLVRRMMFTSELTHLVDSNFRLDDLVAVIDKKIAATLDVDHCTMLLWDAEEGCLAPCGPFVGTEASARPREIRIRLGEGVMGHVAATGAPYIANDAAADPKVIKRFVTDYGVKAVMGVPLKIGRSVIGVMALTAVTNPRVFTDEDAALAQALASEVALAIESTRLYERSQRHADELARSKAQLQSYFSQMGAALTSALNLTQLMELVLDLCTKLVHADGGNLTLVEDGQVTMQVQTGVEPQRSGPEVHGYLGVPLMIKDGVKGLLSVYSREPRQFQPEEVEVLTLFANQAAMAIDNAQHFEQEQRKAKETTLLYKAARSIGNAISLHDVVVQSAQQVAKITETDRCLIFLLDEQHSVLRLAASHGLSDDQHEFFQVFTVEVDQIDPALWSDLRDGKPILAANAPPKSPALQRLFSLLPANSSLIVPLIAKEHLLGILVADDSRSAHHFPPAQVRLVLTLALQIASAIQRARLITQKEESLNQITALYQVSTALTGTLSLPKVFNLIVDKASEILNTPLCVLLTRDPLHATYQVSVSRGLSEEAFTQALQAHIVRLAGHRRRPFTVYAGDREEDEPLVRSLKRADLGGVLAIPLVTDRELIGILNCFAEQGRRFTQQEIRLVRSFANHAVIGMENARLYGLLKGKVHELASLFEVGKAITSTLQPEAVLDAITTSVMKVTGANACSIMLMEPDGTTLAVKSAQGLSKATLGVRVIVGEGIAGEAARTGRPMIGLDLKEDTSGLKFPTRLRKEGYKTILAVPMETQGIVVGALNVYMKDIHYHSREEIHLLQTVAHQAAIAIENSRLYQEQYAIARIIRHNLMPKRTLHFPGLEVGHKYLPSKELSGDYFDLFPLGRGRYGITIADVAGKGTPAAMYTTRGKYALKAYAFAGESPSDVLTMTNALLAPETEPDKFISLFYGVADLGAKTLTFSLAGHAPPLLYKAAEGEVWPLEADGILLGVTPNAVYGESQVVIEKGDALVLFTDGITEARNDKGEEFGDERLLSVVRDNGHLPAQTLATRIHSVAQKFTRRKFLDDFTVLVVKF